MYTITYNVSDAAGNEAETVARTVTVVDTTSTCDHDSGEGTVTVEAGNTYTDAGATASDIVDGDLSRGIITYPSPRVIDYDSPNTVQTFDPETGNWI